MLSNFCFAPDKSKKIIRFFFPPAPCPTMPGVRYERLAMREPPGADIILLNNQQQVLLVLRDNKTSIPFPNTWALLGGYLEENESPEVGIRRELLEEMELELGEVKFFKSYFWEECDEHIFWTRIDLDISNTKLHEGQKLAYFSREEIDHLDFASHYHEILVDFFDSLAVI